MVDPASRGDCIAHALCFLQGIAFDEELQMAVGSLLSVELKVIGKSIVANFQALSTW